MNRIAEFLARLLRRRRDAAPAPAALAALAAPAAPGAPPAMLDCESVMRELWDYLDAELTAERMAAIRAHLEVCRRCYPQLEFERAFLDALAARAPQHSQPERVRARVLDALRARGLSAD